LGLLTSILSGSRPAVHNNVTLGHNIDGTRNICQPIGSPVRTFIIRSIESKCPEVAQQPTTHKRPFREFLSCGQLMRVFLFLSSGTLDSGCFVAWQKRQQLVAPTANVKLPKVSVDDLRRKPQLRAGSSRHVNRASRISI
jgi:FAD synthase